MADPAYGKRELGSKPLSEWLKGERGAEILFAGLFRPVDSVLERIKAAAKRHLFLGSGQVLQPQRT